MKWGRRVCESLPLLLVVLTKLHRNYTPHKLCGTQCVLVIVGSCSSTFLEHSVSRLPGVLWSSGVRTQSVLNGSLHIVPQCDETALPFCMRLREKDHISVLLWKIAHCCILPLHPHCRFDPQDNMASPINHGLAVRDVLWVGADNILCILHTLAMLTPIIYDLCQVPFSHYCDRWAY